MPTIKTIQGFRFFFYSNDHDPPHIHVEKGNKTAKFLLEPVVLIKSKRFNATELKKIRNLVTENVELFKIKWNAYRNIK
jgi:hypothetical protein